jgi:hypothetical protein
VTLINAAYAVGNLARGEEFAKLTPQAWWANMKTGFVWDDNDFGVNQIGHPYQGSNYFNAARANGLSFYESAAMTAFGSATWEYFGEKHDPSFNDFINTTMGGVALGEMFHRAAWLVRNTHATGKGRLAREIGAMAVDPLTGYNRFRTGDASRVTDKPADMVPSSLGASAEMGVLWRGSQSSAFTAQGDPFLEMDAYYGETNTGRSRTPYDAFWIRMRFGGGSGFSEARVRGRLMGQPLHAGGLQFSAVQTYDYQNNAAYSSGAQSIDAALGATHAFSSRMSGWILGWGGLTVLGAIDSLPLGVTEKPERSEPTGSSGSGTATRAYDYGPGSAFGALARLTRDNRDVAMFFYEGRHLFSLDGVRANHLVERIRLDLIAPLHGPLGVGASGEYFIRRSVYQDVDRTVKTFHYPQVRMYLSWQVR